MDNRLKYKTRLKLEMDPDTHQLVGFVSRNTKTGRLNGVRRTAPVPKCVVVVSKDIAPYILPEILYDAVIVPMKTKNGFVAIDLTPTCFDASIESCYIPTQVHRVTVRFGNSSITYDPNRDTQYSFPDIRSCIKALEHHTEINNLDDVIREFCEVAKRIEAKRKDEIALNKMPEIKKVHIGTAI